MMSKHTHIYICREREREREKRGINSTTFQGGSFEVAVLSVRRRVPGKAFGGGSFPRPSLPVLPFFLLSLLSCRYLARERGLQEPGRHGQGDAGAALRALVRLRGGEGGEKGGSYGMDRSEEDGNRMPRSREKGGGSESERGREGGREGGRGVTGTGQESRWRSSSIFSRVKEQSATVQRKRPKAGVRPPMGSAAMPEVVGKERRGDFPLNFIISLPLVSASLVPLPTGILLPLPPFVPPSSSLTWLSHPRRLPAHGRSDV
jgi:hypothetical protein